MVAFLDSQIGLLETGLETFGSVAPDAEGARLVEDLIAIHLTTLDAWRGTSSGGISEPDRFLVPLFQRWLNAAARKVKESAKSLRATGHPVAGYDDLLRAMNRSKPVAERFDYFVELNARLAEEGG